VKRASFSKKLSTEHDVIVCVLPSRGNLFPTTERLELPPIYRRLSALPLQPSQKGKDQDVAGGGQAPQDEHHLRPRAALVRARLPRRRQHEGYHRVIQEHRTRMGRPDF
jgi:hypothetical protein